MDSHSPKVFCRIPTPAPALSRGLAVLAELDAQLLSLDALARRLNLPKASIFRLLSSLLKLGMIRKTTDKRYEAVWVLRPLQDGATRFRESLFGGMSVLCAEADCTVEWYEPTSEGMKLIRQENPKTELRVQARPGFVRDWHTELDAVARLGHAFSEEAPKKISGSLRIYSSNGVLRSLSPSEVARLIGEAKARHTASDSIFNLNGVRRHAAAAFREKTFLGVLAVAENFRFQKRPLPAFFRNKLTELLNRLP